MRKLLTLTPTLLLLCAAFSNSFGQATDLSVEGPYVHRATGTIFPADIQHYHRKNLRAYNSEQTDVSGSYEWLTGVGQSLITVYVYPGGEGTEGRLRRAYRGSLNDMLRTVGPGNNPTQTPRTFMVDGFKINGFSGTVVQNSVSRVTVFECGQWLFKMRTTTALIDSAELSALEAQVLKIFRPTDLVKSFPLKLTGSITISQDILKDAVMLACETGSATEKLKWAKQNVDSLERLAGFPDLYLGMHVESAKKFVELAAASTGKKKSSTKKYIEELNELLASGYVEEFFMDAYRGVLIVPKDVQLDEAGYFQWRDKRKSKADLLETFSLVTYSVD